MTACGSRRAGFTLIEALVGATLGAVLVGLVTSVFLAQNRFFDDVVRRSRVQENARTVAEVVQAEVRPAARGSVVLAESRHVAIRTPHVLGVVCEIDDPWAYVYLALNGEPLSTAEVSGYAVWESDGMWSYYAAPWSDFFDSSGGSAVERCEDAGLESVGLAESDFMRLAEVATNPSPPAEEGTPLMIFRELAYRIQASELEDGALGLYRGLYGDTLVEFATGLTADARFEYRLEGEADFQSSVSAGDLAAIVTLRVVSTATESEAPPGDPSAYEYGFAVDIPLRNAR